MLKVPLENKLVYKKAATRHMGSTVRGLYLVLSQVMIRYCFQTIYLHFWRGWDLIFQLGLD